MRQVHIAKHFCLIFYAFLLKYIVFRELLMMSVAGFYLHLYMN